jgi:hypothetical protein
MYDDYGTAGVRTDDRVTRREGNDKTQASLLFRVRTRGPPARWTLTTLTTLRDEGLPGPVGARDPYGRFRTFWGLASLDGTVPVTTGQVRVRAWTQGREEVLRPPAGDPLVERQGQGALQADVRLARGPGSGGAVTRLRFEGRAATSEEGAAQRATWSTTVDGAWRPGPAVTLEAVVLGQGLWTARAGQDLASSFILAPRGAIAYRPGPAWTLRAAGGRTWRPPDFLELFGDRGPVQGRADLRPERGVFVDAGARFDGTDAGVEAGVFASQLRDRIVFVQNGQRAVVPVNVGQSLSAGLEAAGWLHGQVLDLRGQGTLNPTWVQSERAGQDRRPIPRVPAVTVVLDGGVRWRTYARLAGSVDLVAGNAWDEANLSRAAPRLLAGTYMTLQPDAGWPSVSLEVRNLTNQLAQAGPRDFGNPDDDRALRPLTDFVGYPLPGRTLLVTFRWTAPSASTRSPTASRLR